MNKIIEQRFYFFIWMMCGLFISSCVPVKKLSYFNDLRSIEEPVANPREQKVIQPFDYLYVKVISIDEKTNAIFNTSDELRYGASVSPNMVSYLVNDKGNINFPFVGNINVVGLTTDEAALKIQTSLNEYVSNAAVVVKFINNNVSLIGEVERQGMYPFSQEKLTIYEALALGGGLTRYGDHRNVVLVRQVGDKIMHYRLDLSDSKIAGKEYYYVLPNDVIIVEPLKAVSTSYTNVTYTTVLSSVTTLIAILLFIGVKF